MEKFGDSFAYLEGHVIIRCARMFQRQHTSWSRFTLGESELQFGVWIDYQTRHGDVYLHLREES